MSEEGQPPRPDPHYTRSFGWPLSVAMLALLVSFAWALHDEFHGRRPYKGYQDRFVELYRGQLEELSTGSRELEREVMRLPEYVDLKRQIDLMAPELLAQVRERDDTLKREVAPRISAIYDVLKNARSLVAHFSYELETAAEEDKPDLRGKLEEAKQGPFVVEAVIRGTTETQEFPDFDALNSEVERLRGRKAALQREIFKHMSPLRSLERRLETVLRKHLTGLPAKDLVGLMRKLDDFDHGIRQIHVPDVDLVDRCESCHLGIREPVLLTAESMGNERAFVSHPRRELLEIHDPEEFGCSPCHGGNGVAVTSVELAHGLNKHWLWPLHYDENMEAGCVQCHREDLVVRGGGRLNDGKELYRHLGCWGCHRYEGFDREAEALTELAKERAVVIRSWQRLERSLREEKRFRRTVEAPDDDATERDIAGFEARIVASHAKTADLTLEKSELASRAEQLTEREQSLLRERKKIGPSLKEARVKLKREWIPVWLADPHAFRPDTTMPFFRLTEEQQRAIAAFVWQAGVDAPIPAHARGDPQRGKELFDSRGCLGCHTVDRDVEVETFDEEGRREILTQVRPVGDGFSANLSRVGEKLEYDYLVRWIHNPRERTFAYCANENRDIGPEVYHAHGLPFVLDPDHSTCPECGHELQTQQMTVMPNLRLTWDESRDVASYLMRLVDPSAVYREAAYMSDPALKERGQTLVRHFGCAGCHEIAGFEEEARIGTELTNEGSKPIERLDFALLAHDARRGRLPDGRDNVRAGRNTGWYDHKGFFEQKLDNPEVFDQGKEKQDPLERLRMPDFRLSRSELDALTTFLLGSVDSVLPERYFYGPTGRERDIQQGWWILKKYNCVGCHQMLPGETPALWGLPRFKDEGFDADGSPHLGLKDRPPSLVGEGARVDPAWLVRFLEDPALDRKNPNKNGVRPYVSVRMPSFEFSEREIGKLVRYFEAVSAQESPYVRPALEPLGSEELQMARTVFLKSECIKCHATEGPRGIGKDTIAPSFLLVPERLKPGWTRRWLVDPALLMPGTRMPTGLFEWKRGRWVIGGEVPDALRGYTGDHVELFLRYMNQYSRQEEQEVSSR